ncbi:uncharacterized protein BJ171DRAFT_501159 [Polychytrium aggregatum]|uniref:uncharacterized protein n=1 Tax=Polychytrium aggregatum TaxID=110093 RepID=UPI0022FF3850|nr:uncharacterized protein BJ171DRAFT_501159 [Polychytrium aggregatum]KAI9205669.1 hypothetical protein BJ171DRAFT_501159 [Polychytrium aggregatum]
MSNSLSSSLAADSSFSSLLDSDIFSGLDSILSPSSPLGASNSSSFDLLSPSGLTSPSLSTSTPPAISKSSTTASKPSMTTAASAPPAAPVPAPAPIPPVKKKVLGSSSKPPSSSSKGGILSRALSPTPPPVARALSPNPAPPSVSRTGSKASSIRPLPQKSVEPSPSKTPSPPPPANKSTKPLAPAPAAVSRAAAPSQSTGSSALGSSFSLDFDFDSFSSSKPSSSLDLFDDKRNSFPLSKSSTPSAASLSSSKKVSSDDFTPSKLGQLLGSSGSASPKPKAIAFADAPASSPAGTPKLDLLLSDTEADSDREEGLISMLKSPSMPVGRSPSMSTRSPSLTPRELRKKTLKDMRKSRDTSRRLSGGFRSLERPERPTPVPVKDPAAADQFERLLQGSETVKMTSTPEYLKSIEVKKSNPIKLEAKPPTVGKSISRRASNTDTRRDGASRGGQETFFEFLKNSGPNESEEPKKAKRPSDAEMSLEEFLRQSEPPPTPEEPKKPSASDSLFGKTKSKFTMIQIPHGSATAPTPVIKGVGRPRSLDFDYEIMDIPTSVVNKTQAQAQAPPAPPSVPSQKPKVPSPAAAHARLPTPPATPRPSSTDLKSTAKPDAEAIQRTSTPAEPPVPVVVPEPVIALPPPKPDITVPEKLALTAQIEPLKDSASVLRVQTHLRKIYPQLGKVLDELEIQRSASRSIVTTLPFDEKLTQTDAVVLVPEQGTTHKVLSDAACQTVHDILVVELVDDAVVDGYAVVDGVPVEATHELIQEYHANKSAELETATAAASEVTADGAEAQEPVHRYVVHHIDACKQCIAREWLERDNLAKSIVNEIVDAAVSQVDVEAATEAPVEAPVEGDTELVLEDATKTASELPVSEAVSGESKDIQIQTQTETAEIQVQAQTETAEIQVQAQAETAEIQVQTAPGSTTAVTEISTQTDNKATTETATTEANAVETTAAEVTVTETVAVRSAPGVDQTVHDELQTRFLELENQLATERANFAHQLESIKSLLAKERQSSQQHQKDQLLLSSHVDQFYRVVHSILVDNAEKQRQVEEKFNSFVDHVQSKI